MLVSSQFWASSFSFNILQLIQHVPPNSKYLSIFSHLCIPGFLKVLVSKTSPLQMLPTPIYIGGATIYSYICIYIYIHTKIENDIDLFRCSHLWISSISIYVYVLYIQHNYIYIIYLCEYIIYIIYIYIHSYYTSASHSHIRCLEDHPICREPLGVAELLADATGVLTSPGTVQKMTYPLVMTNIAIQNYSL